MNPFYLKTIEKGSTTKQEQHKNQEKNLGFVIKELSMNGFTKKMQIEHITFSVHACDTFTGKSIALTNN
jgi:hypothetical protein